MHGCPLCLDGMDLICRDDMIIDSSEVLWLVFVYASTIKMVSVVNTISESESSAVSWKHKHCAVLW